MIVTHTRNASGQRRIYLGGKGSLECWIDPAANGHGWTFHMAGAVTGLPVSSDDQRSWANYTLLKLAELLDVAPQDLRAVSFECIAALHTDDPFKGHRTPSPCKRSFDECFMATVPHVTRPKADFASSSGQYGRHRR